ncbi:MAG: hypothetical protein LC624_05540, partial [Halobacteriales archaeon]|nr:hypothetical protein [Halobacteriales archaeon]
CILFEGTTCLQYQCTANCTPTYQNRFFPELRGIELERVCPQGDKPLPDVACACPTIPAPTFVAPTSQIYVRGQPTGTASPMPLLVQGQLSVVAKPATGKQVILTGLSQTVTSAVGVNASLTLNSASVPRGVQTFLARSIDAQSCTSPQVRLDVFVEQPVLKTWAQALRVQGNIPLNLVLGSVPVAPADTLRGSEDSVVADPQMAAPLALVAHALSAQAEHGPVAGAENLLHADASAGLLDAQGTLDLAALCADLTGQAACATLPTVQLDHALLEGQATADMQLMTATGSAGSGKLVGKGFTAIGANGERHSIDSCPLTAHVAVLPGGPSNDVPTPVACVTTIGPLTIQFSELRTADQPLAHEAWADALHITVAQGPFAGEVRIGSAYAGISLGGASLLQGPPTTLRPDDFGTGADAPSGIGQGPLLADGAYSGAFAGADRADAFRASTAAGEKLKVTLLPAHKVGLGLNPLPTLPNPDAAPRLVHIALYDPLGVQRDTSLVTAPAERASVEINADVAGAWSIVLTRTDHLDEPAPYTALIEHVGMAYVPGDNGPSGDAPSLCAGALAMNNAAVGAIPPGDDADSYVVHVTAPGALVATLAVPDPDGADLDLELRAAGSCNLLARSTMGKDPTLPKGTPDSLVLQNLTPGDYVLRVVRFNGVDDYVLNVVAVKPA